MYTLNCKYLETGREYILGEHSNLKDATDHKLRAMKKAAFQRCELKILVNSNELRTVDKPRLN